MLWARVVLGMNSMEKDVTPVAAISRIVSKEPSGRRNPIKTWPRRRNGTSALPVWSFEP